MAARLTLAQAQQNVIAITQEIQTQTARGVPVSNALLARLMAAQAALNTLMAEQINQNGRLAQLVENQARALEGQDVRMEAARARALGRIEAIQNNYRQEVATGAGLGLAVGGAAGVGALALFTGGVGLAAGGMLVAGGVGAAGGAVVGGYAAHANNRANFNNAVNVAKDLERT